MFSVSDSFSLLYPKTTRPESNNSSPSCSKVKREQNHLLHQPLNSGLKQWPQRLGPSAPVLTIKAAPTVLVVDVLCEAIFLEQLMGRMLELGQGLRGTAIAANCRCSF